MARLPTIGLSDDDDDDDDDDVNDDDKGVRVCDEEEGEDSSSGTKYPNGLPLPFLRIFCLTCSASFCFGASSTLTDAASDPDLAITCSLCSRLYRVGVLLELVDTGADVVDEEADTVDEDTGTA
jgi:hypothetical protein